MNTLSLFIGISIGWLICYLFTRKENNILRAINANLTDCNKITLTQVITLRTELDKTTELAQRLSELCNSKGWNLAGLHQGVAVIKNLPPIKENR